MPLPRHVAHEIGDRIFTVEPVPSPKLGKGGSARSLRMHFTLNCHLRAMASELHDAFDHGKKISPVLPQGKKNFLIDIDGFLC